MEKMKKNKVRLGVENPNQFTFVQYFANDVNYRLILELEL